VLRVYALLRLSEDGGSWSVSTFAGSEAKCSKSSGMEDGKACLCCAIRCGVLQVRSVEPGSRSRSSNRTMASGEIEVGGSEGVY